MVLWDSLRKRYIALYRDFYNGIRLRFVLKDADVYSFGFRQKLWNSIHSFAEGKSPTAAAGHSTQAISASA
ncbi:MAG: hypothetical protein ABIZ80_20185, partial [Bryobacteraceae bacterium]